jgi:hypothetical protein
MPVLGPAEHFRDGIMTERETPSTKSWDRRGASHSITGGVELAPAEAERAAVELDLRAHDSGSDATAARSDVERTTPVREAPDEDELVSRRQAADRFGLDPGLLSRWEKAGRLTPRRKTPRGRVYYAVLELKHAVSEHAFEDDGADDRRHVGAELVFPPERLWAMVEEARRDALHARTRASAAEAEVTLLKEMVDRLLSGRVDASNPPSNEKAAERARRWAEQWDQHEQQQERQQREQQTSPRGSWWSRNRAND